MFESLLENKAAKRALAHLIEKPSSPLLFTQLEKEEIAKEFALQLLESQKQQHPDLFEFFPEGKSHIHTVAAMKRLGKEIELAPYEAKRKVFIIHEAHRLSETSGNTVLKTLEDHHSQAIVILIATSKHLLLPTISSRCLEIPFRNTQSQSAADPLLPSLLENPSLDVFENVEKEIGEDKERAKALLEQLFHELARKGTPLSKLDKAQRGFDHHIRLRSVLEYLSIL